MSEQTKRIIDLLDEDTSLRVPREILPHFTKDTPSSRIISVGNFISDLAESSTSPFVKENGKPDYVEIWRFLMNFIRSTDSWIVIRRRNDDDIETIDYLGEIDWSTENIENGYDHLVADVFVTHIGEIHLSSEKFLQSVPQYVESFGIVSNSIVLDDVRYFCKGFKKI